MTSFLTSGHGSSPRETRHAPNPDPYRWHAIGVTVVFTLTLPTIIATAVLLKPAPAWSAEAVALGVDRLEIARGELVYKSSCAVCHGPSGDGIPRLGKPLHNSAFVQSRSDADLIRLVINGRPVSDPLNTTRALMPPRGAVGLSDDKIAAVVTYLRAIQNPEAPTVSMAAWESTGDATDGGATGGAAIELTSHPGYDLFVSSCAACHGQGGQGIESLGLPLTTSGFVLGKSDKDLITFIKVGRPIWDENNTTGLDMPPKGGNPAITDDQLQSIVDYIQSLQKEALGS